MNSFVSILSLLTHLLTPTSHGVDGGRQWWEKASAYGEPASPAGPPQPLEEQAVSADVEPEAMRGMTEQHNRWRRDHSLPPLVWSSKLEKSAQTWADSLASRGCKMVHSGAPGVGENLAWSLRDPLEPAEVVDMWGSEVADYDYAGNRCAPGKMCGHYTQVVWDDTRQVGCAVAHCAASVEEVWVCQYAPPGNWRGERPY